MQNMKSNTMSEGAVSKMCQQPLQILGFHHSWFGIGCSIGEFSLKNVPQRGSSMHTQCQRRSKRHTKKTKSQTVWETNDLRPNLRFEGGNETILFEASLFYNNPPRPPGQHLARNTSLNSRLFLINTMAMNQSESINFFPNST